MRQANTIDEKGVNMNNKAAKLAAEHYGKTLDEVEVSRIDFFMSLWAALDGADAAGQTAAGYEVPPAERVAALSEAEIPVFSNAPVEIDAEALARGMSAVIARAAELGGFDAEMAAALTGVNWDDAIAASDVALAGKKPMEYLAAFAEQLVDGGMTELQAQMGQLFASLALRWQLEGPAEAVARARKKAKVFYDHQMHCPACGGDAALARVGEGGSGDGRNKTLWCAQCGTSWEFDRIRCPRCGTRNQGNLHYFNIEGDEGHRIGTCDECGSYIRTRFAGEGDNAPYSPEVEDVVMARLDAVAMDPSFAGGSAKRTGE